MPFLFFLFFTNPLSYGTQKWSSGHTYILYTHIHIFTSHFIRCTCSFMELPNQPIMWQQCNAEDHEDTGASVNVHIRHQNLQSLKFTQNGVLNQKTSSEREFCGRKPLVDDRGQRRMARLVQADRKAIITQKTVLYNCGEQKSIS